MSKAGIWGSRNQGVWGMRAIALSSIAVTYHKKHLYDDSSELQNVEQGISNRRGENCPARHFKIRHSLFDILNFKCFCFAFVGMMTAGLAAGDRGLEIMQEVERRALSDSQSYEGAIEVIDSRGKVLNKGWHFWREGNRGKSKVLVRFDLPAEVRGVGLLTLNHAGGRAEQWLYTPSIQRDRRIAPQEKSQRFMGTDFSNEDMEERAVEDYDYELIGEESFAGQPSYKIKAVCKDRANTQYSQLYFWVRKDIVATAYVEFFVDGKLSKTLRWDDWKQIQNIWTPHFVEMKDLSRRSTTRIRSMNVRYNIRFEPEWFTLRNLRRVS
jgi:hypothetical protein